MNAERAKDILYPGDARIMFIAQQIEERQIRLFEEMGLQLLYTLKPRPPFLDVVSPVAQIL